LDRILVEAEVRKPVRIWQLPAESQGSEFLDSADFYRIPSILLNWGKPGNGWVQFSPAADFWNPGRGHSVTLVEPTFWSFVGQALVALR
jgi:hypothetical protein